ncbi:MAG: antibiotic biosynthesis monooxygenase [Bacteroidetes bacterium]|nr:MAG: antibiotic biosynthesis monooxygenase [Bacteroidota bacterium]
MNIKKIALIVSIAVFVMALPFCNYSNQNKNQMVRLAKLVIDPTQLENYKALLKEEIEASIRLERGVLTLYAVVEKNDPTHITILEIYADTVAYKSHLLTPHFIKYKNGTKDMVKSLELVETVPLIPGMKIK